MSRSMSFLPRARLFSIGQAGHASGRPCLTAAIPDHDAPRDCT
jgi:hypothetical protein